MAGTWWEEEGRCEGRAQARKKQEGGYEVHFWLGNEAVPRRKRLGKREKSGLEAWGILYVFPRIEFAGDATYAALGWAHRGPPM